MPEINYLAVVVAAIVAFIGSSIWYVVFGKELEKVSKAFAEMKPEAWRVLVVLAGSLVLSFVVAYVIGLTEISGWLEAIGVGLLLWAGLSAVQWLGAIVWEKTPVKLAAIHSGDWLMKLVVISAIVGVWR